MRSVTEMLLLKWGGVLYTVLVEPPPPWRICVLLMQLLSVTLVSDLSMRTNKFCSLFVLTVDWHRRKRRLSLSTSSTVEICWQHSTPPVIQSVIGHTIFAQIKKRITCPKPRPFRGVLANVHQRIKFEAGILCRCLVIWRWNIVTLRTGSGS